MPDRPDRRAPLLAAALLTLVLGVTSAGVAAPAQAHDRVTSTAAAAGPARYVALGDSYASGEGLAPYETGTDTSTDRCHRSVELSYPELLERGDDPAFDGLGSVACSGGVTTSLFARSNDEPAQLDALSADTRTVTLSIGGNDVGFSEVLSSCIFAPVASPEIEALFPGRPGCRTRLNLPVTARIAYLAKSTERTTYGKHRSLPGVVAAIHRRAPQATIYVSSYPQLIGTTSTSPLGCQVGALGQVPLVITAADAAWMRGRSLALNAAVETSVAKARIRGIDARFVDLGAAFRGHNVCDSGTPWINPLLIGASGVSPASFHPTARGQQAYAEAVQAAAATAPTRRPQP